MSNQSSFKEAALQSIAQQEEQAKQAAAFKADLVERITNYNTVVTNTVRKFASEQGIWGAVHQELILDPKSELISLAYGKYTFELNGKRTQISEDLLRNDPMIVAQYTRLLIRKFQEDKKAKEYKAFKAELTKAKGDFTRAEKALASAQTQFDLAEARAKRAEKRAEKRIMGNVAARRFGTTFSAKGVAVTPASRA